MTLWAASHYERVTATTPILSGCINTFIHHNVTTAQVRSNCSESERVDDSPLAVLTIPVVAFFVSHWSLHDMKLDD
jgi:hypothetical protein